jgi:hypothetical protein
VIHPSWKTKTNKKGFWSPIIADQSNGSRFGRMERNATVEPRGRQLQSGMWKPQSMAAGPGLLISAKKKVFP